MVNERNVLGGDLSPCAVDPRVGRHQGGACDGDHGACGGHGEEQAVCATMTQEFLRHQRSVGNDLTVRSGPQEFPGLRPGDSWCVRATSWLQSYEAGIAPPVWLAGTSERALEVVPLETLSRHAVDVPPDPGHLPR